MQFAVQVESVRRPKPQPAGFVDVIHLSEETPDEYPSSPFANTTYEHLWKIGELS